MPDSLCTTLSARSWITPVAAGTETPWFDPSRGTMVGAIPAELQVFVSFPPPFLTLDFEIPPAGARAGFRSTSLPLLSGCVRTPTPSLRELGGASASPPPLSSCKRVSSRAMDALSRSSSSSSVDRRLRVACISGCCRLSAAPRSPPPSPTVVRPAEQTPCLPRP